MDKKLRILYISAFHHPGAGNRVLVNWLKWKARNGYGTYAACPNTGWLGQQLEAVPGRKVLNTTYFIPDRKSALKALFIVLSTCLFILRHRIDVIHCNSDKAYYMACLAAKLTRRPIVTHLRFHYTDHYYQWLFGKWRKPQMIVLVSDAFRHEDEDKLQRAAPGVPIRVLHNCIDPDDYSVIIPETNMTSTEVFYPAAISERKRQHQLYELDRLLSQHNSPCIFIAAGKVNEPAYWQRCENEAQSNPGHNVRFLGHINDVNEGYRTAFLSVSLSVYETFGYSVLESMAMGVPVVGYQVDAVEEVIGSSEQLVAQDDVRALASKIRRLRSDRQLWRRCSQKARQRVTDHFAPNRICPVLIDYYREVLK